MGSQLDFSKIPAMRTNPKIIFFTDFDGTITMKDSNDYLTDNLGFGYELRRKSNREVLEGRKSFRDSFREMLQSIHAPFPKLVETVVQNIKLDPYFKEFFMWSRENNIPVVVLSSGMEPIIKALLTHLVGKEAEEIQVICNQVVAKPGMSIDQENGWEIEYHDDSHFGHDKSLAIKPYQEIPDGERPIMLYAGDGVSDLSAAKETDLLFAKEGQDLIVYCARAGDPFTQFEDWSTILSVVKEIASGKKTVQDAAEEGYNEFRLSGMSA